MQDLRWSIGAGVLTPANAAHNIRPDCVPALGRDAAGALWLIAGHSGYGRIGVFKGPTADRLEKQYDAELCFATGAAGAAFDGSCYPDGPRARGEVWATGLWIVPPDATRHPGRFYALFHNETGWGADDTGYTAFAQEQGEPDFRHIGLMASDDQGRTWHFHRWVITAAEQCYSEVFRPDGLTTGGQPAGVINLGAGDLSVFYQPEQRLLYCFYSMIRYDMGMRNVVADEVYVARAEVSATGELGEFRKFHRGVFTSPGNGGAETPVMTGGAEPCVAFHRPSGRYLLTTYNRAYWGSGSTLQVCTSDDLVTWTPPVRCDPAHAELSMPYFALANREPDQPHNFLGDEFDLLVCANNTDIKAHRVMTAGS